MSKNFCKVEHKWCKHCSKSSNVCKLTNKPLKETKKCQKRINNETVSLRNLVKSVAFEDVMDAMCSYWPDQIDNINGYHIVFEKLKTIKGEKCNIQISISECEDEYGGEIHKYLDVVGIENGKSWAIEMVKWSNWATMNIHPDTLKKFSSETIVAGSLYEMTWCGFTEEKVSDYKKDLEESINECKKLVNNPN